FTYDPVPQPKIIKPRVSIFSTATLLAISNASVAALIRFPSTTLSAIGSGVANLTIQTFLVVKKLIVQANQAYSSAELPNISRIIKRPAAAVALTLLSISDASIATFIRSPSTILSTSGG